MLAVNVMGEVMSMYMLEPEDTYMYLNGSTTLLDIATKFPDLNEMRSVCQQYWYLRNAYGIAA